MTKKPGPPKIKILFVIMIILLLIVGANSLYNTFYSQQLDIAPIKEGQTNITYKIDELISKINSLRTDINQLETNTASKSDIDNINSRLDKINAEISNIDAIQNVDITNTNTWINIWNIIFNISLIFNMVVALGLIKMSEFIVSLIINWWKNRKKLSEAKSNQSNESH